jgi:hypothetical protein
MLVVERSHLFLQRLNPGKTVNHNERGEHNEKATACIVFGNPQWRFKPWVPFPGGCALFVVVNCAS